MRELKDLFLQAPDTQLDPYLVKLISKWNKQPTALQILEVVDNAIYSGMTSGFMIIVFQRLLDDALEKENTTHEEIAKLALWRNRMENS